MSKIPVMSRIVCKIDGKSLPEPGFAPLSMVIGQPLTRV
jgi:hypothetical protein